MSTAMFPRYVMARKLSPLIKHTDGRNGNRGRCGAHGMGGRKGKNGKNGGILWVIRNREKVWKSSSRYDAKVEGMKVVQYPP